MGLRILLIVFACLAPLSAQALSLTNDSEVKLKTSIEKWVRFINAGETVRFAPSEVPVTVYLQFPFTSMTCRVTEFEAEIRVTEQACYVDGVLVAEPQVQF